MECSDCFSSIKEQYILFCQVKNSIAAHS
jgi:hypothetical protein